MALIVEYHVVADMYPVSTSAITAGMIVSLNTSGQAVPAPVIGTLGVGQNAIGIAGDSSLAAAAQTTAYSAQVVIGADGAGTRWTENRVSDFYDETVASQKITIYNGGGKFWVSENLFDVVAGIVPGTRLGVSSATAGEWEDSVSATVADDDIVGIAVGANTAYDSGVPGTDTTDGSISLGNFVPLVLRI
jgi:hypothetical protein